MSDSTCAKCGGAFAEGAKRFRDKRGRSFCAACAEVLRKPRASEPAPEGDGYALADEPKIVGGASSGVGPMRDLTACPSCGGAMIRSDIICTKCGFNRESGRRAGASGDESGDQPRPAPKRRKPATVRDDVLREHRNAYVKPAVATAICLPIAMAIWSGVGQPAGMVVRQLVVFAVMYIAALVVWFVCSVLWIGFDEPMGMEAVRLGAVCAMTEIARAALSPLPNFWRVQAGAQIAITMVFVGATIVVMKMEKEDAWAFAVLAWGARFATAYMAYRVAVVNGWI